METTPVNNKPEITRERAQEVARVVRLAIEGDELDPSDVKQAFKNLDAHDIARALFMVPPSVRRAGPSTLDNLTKPHKTPKIDILEPHIHDKELSDSVKSLSFDDEGTKRAVTEIASYLEIPLITDDMTDAERDMWLKQNQQALQTVSLLVGKPNLEREYTNAYKQNKITASRITAVIGFTDVLLQGISLTDEKKEEVERLLEELKEDVDGNKEKGIPNYFDKSLAQKLEVVEKTSQLARDVAIHFTQK